MLVEPETTWLLVSTSPDEVRMMPVPAALPPWMTVFMSTTTGSILAASAARLGLTADGAAAAGAWGHARVGPLRRGGGGGDTVRLREAPADAEPADQPDQADRQTDGCHSQ